MKTPNVLLLFPDQARHDGLGAGERDWLATPNLDALCREGCRFTRAYTPNPLCMPARYSLLTGRSPRAHGFFGIQGDPMADAGLPTLPQVFSERGWATAAVGKMHFHPVRRHHGFEWMRLMEELPRYRAEDDYARYLAAQGHARVQNLHGVRPLLYHEPQLSLVPEAQHGEAWVDREAADWIDGLGGKRPFLLMCGWIKPHPPWNLPPRLAELHAKRPIPDPIPRSRAFPYPAEANAYYGDFDSPDEMRRIREAYWGSLSLVDESIGRLLGHLKKRGLDKDTIVVYASDHGEMLQDKGFYSKAVPYESSVRIPLVVRWPERLRAGSTDDRLCELHDLFPTLLDLAGLPHETLPGGKQIRHDGLSLVGPAKRSHLHVSCLKGRDRWSAVRGERWKYVRFYNGGAEQLFDLDSDPGETHDLVAMGDAPPTVLADLRQRVAAYEAEHGPEGCMENGTFKDFPARAMDPAVDANAACKYPSWAHRHLQEFTEEEGRAAMERFIHEASLALGTERVADYLAKRAPGEAWKRQFIAEFLRRGATEAEVERLFPGASGGCEANDGAGITN